MQRKPTNMFKMEIHSSLVVFGSWLKFISLVLGHDSNFCDFC